MRILKGHLATKPVRSLAFSPDGTKLASSARDYKTFLWDLASGGYEVIEESEAHTVAFSPDGTTIATGRNYDVALWHIPTGAGRLQRPDNDRFSGPRLAFSPDGKHLAGATNVVRVWEVSAAETFPILFREDTDGATGGLAYSRDGSTLATAHVRPYGKVVFLLDTDTWRRRKVLLGATRPIEALSFTPDGKYLAGCGRSDLWVWKVASGTFALCHTVNSQHFKDVAFSPDGRLLAFARNDATVSFLSVGDWREVAAYDWKVGPIVSLAFAPDGMRCAAGSGRGKIVVFDVDL